MPLRKHPHKCGAVTEIGAGVYVFRFFFCRGRRGVKVIGCPRAPRYFGPHPVSRKGYTVYFTALVETRRTPTLDTVLY